MTAQVVVGLIIPSAVNQLELSRPVIFPTCCQVVVVEVVVVNEIVHTSMCIETGSCAEVQYAHTLVPMFIDSIKLPTFVVQVGVEHIGDAVLIVSGKCGALLPRTQVNGQRWRKAMVTVGQTCLVHLVRVHTPATVIDKTRGKLQPVESSNMVDESQVFVLEFRHWYRITHDFLKCFIECSVRCGVTVRPRIFYISVALGVVSHAKRNIEVE